jgi:hypothetical protein
MSNSPHQQLVQNNLIHLKNQGAFHQFLYQPCNGFKCRNYVFMSDFCSTKCKLNNMKLIKECDHCETCCNLLYPYHSFIINEKSSIDWRIECMFCFKNRLIISFPWVSKTSDGYFEQWYIFGS